MSNTTKHEEIKLTTKIGDLPGVGTLTANRLSKLGLKRVTDLLLHLPMRLEDRSEKLPISTLPYNHECVIEGRIASVFTRVSKNGVLIIQAKITDDSGGVAAVWFNQRFLLKELTIGRQLTLFGQRKPIVSMNKPFFVKKIINQIEIAPIYPSTSGVSQLTIRKLLKIVEPLAAKLVDVLPKEIISEQLLPSRSVIIAKTHFNCEIDTLDRAYELLSLEELVILNLRALKMKFERQKISSPSITIDTELLKEVVKAVKFELTDGQRRTAWQIIQDISSSTPMNRLLYGEVGSGKTVVAMLAAASVAKQKFKVIWLNPTTILASQQAETLREIFEPMGLKIGLQTALKKSDIEQLDIVVGTHALLNDKLTFSNLGLIVIDEQQRFGSDQRESISLRYPQANLLMMTATPIPRTLAQSIFGFLDITLLKDKPRHQKPVDTVVFTDVERAKIESEIAKKIQKGQPGYVICPLIEEAVVEPGKLFAEDRKAVNKELIRLKKVFPKSKIGVIHGKLPTAEREATINEFKTGQLDILLSTTVVEVGIDNPNATWILIEEADRFGLSQLHQLRGRVGRGAESSHCYLSNSSESETVKKRLEVLTTSQNGLEIAEADLELRGAGDIVGLEQSGLPSLKYATLSNQHLIDQSLAIAEEIIARKLEHYPPLAKAMVKQIHSEKRS